ncbi:MAG: YHS domain-containing protein [Planctomycetes bacterium]|nr:YHS domain-containing protein [Planctomycetota bacterium]
MRAFASIVFVFAFAAPLALLVAQEPTPAVAPVDFQKQIAPMLLARCIDCHGPKEQKGDLRLDAKAHLFPQGDEAEWSVVPGKPDDSDLLRRLGLPADDDDVMPAKGEPLTKEQQELFRRWIAEGAVWPAEADEWLQKEIAAAVIPKITFDLPPVDDAQKAAIAKAVQALQKIGAVVQPVAADTEALDVNLSLLRDKVTDAEFALLVPLAPRLVWLNVSRTAVGDAIAKDLGELRELRRLHAANTKLGDAAFTVAAKLPHLEYVNAYGSAMGDGGLAALAAGPKVQRVYAWQSKVTAEGGKAALAAQPRLQLDLGDYVEGRLAAAQKEIDERAARNKPVNEMCPVATDKKVDPAHSVEHDGRRIGFCCAKCKAAFQKDPAKYAANLPPK